MDAEAVKEDLTGELLGGRYRIIRSIGAGGMGGVYEAKQEGLGRRVAVKVIASSLADEPEYIERFRREALASAQLGHPNIVQVTDFQCTPGQPPFLVMELLEGEPLQKRLQRGRFEPSQAIDITRQLLAALEAAHAQGIVHRDLKPANVFLVPMASERVLVKLVDFGIAKLTESATFARLTSTGMMIGTPRYAAPEQLRDSSSVDARTDLYAAGVLLFCMLSGRLPFMSSGAQLIVDIETTRAPDLCSLVPTLDPAIAQVVQRAMEKEPSRRFASAREMSERLAPLVDGGRPRAAQPIAGTAHMSAVHTPTPTRAPRHSPVPMQRAPQRMSPTPFPPQRKSDPSRLSEVPHTRAPRSRPSAPTHPPQPVAAPPSQARTIILTALSVVLVTLIGVAAVGGTWLVLSMRDGSHSSPLTPPAAPQYTVPGDCLEWERIACSCPNTRTRGQYCGMAVATNQAYADGDTSADCPGLLAAMRQACSVPNP